MTRGRTKNKELTEEVYETALRIIPANASKISIEFNKERDKKITYITIRSYLKFLVKEGRLTETIAEFKKNETR